jgi:prepilin-type N-terminal cleavage/methylation domain-containing protein
MINRLPVKFRADLATPPNRVPRAFSLVELVVVIAILAILAAISMTALSRAHKARNNLLCATNLRTIGLALQNYASDNSDVYPQPSTAAQWEDLLRKYIRRTTFCCPSDQELFPATGSSYDWRDTGDPLSSLAGRRTADVARGDVSLAYDALPGWHDPHKVQVVLTDSSVHLINEDVFLRELQMPVGAGP